MVSRISVEKLCQCECMCSGSDEMKVKVKVKGFIGLGRNCSFESFQ